MDRKKAFTIISAILLMLLVPFTIIYAEENNEGENQEENPDEIIKRENIPNPDDIPDPPRDESLVGDEEDVFEVEIETPSSVTGEKMEGSGTVVDFSTTGAKAFYTIVDNDNETFYLIIDMDKPDNNVYFLSDINKEQLASGSNVTQNNKNSGIFEKNEDQEEQEKQEENETSEVISSQEENSKKSSNLTFLLVVISVGLVGAFGYYFLVIKRKQNSIDQYDEDEEMLESYEDEDFIEEKIEEERSYESDEK